MKRATWIGSAALAAALISTCAVAQWSAVPSKATTESGNDARVRNDEGAELRIWLDIDAHLRATFRLPKGLVMLDPEGCPTFRIDDEKPENLSAPPHECAVSGDTASVVLTRADDGQVESTTLLNLMNGSKLRVLYRLSNAGYSATGFSLRGSKQALGTALGDGMSVVGE